MTKVAVAAAVAALGLSGCKTKQVPSLPPVVTVLTYHTFDGPKKTPFTVSSARFEEQLRFIQTQRIPVIPLEQLVKYLREGGPIPDRSVVITIDDGYKTAITKAWPLLHRFNFPFTLYVYTNAISRIPSALTWEDIAFLAKQGVDIQSHTLTHPLLTHPPYAMSKKEYVAWLDHELQASKKILENHLGKPVLALAYPFGGYDEVVVDRVRTAGYTSATTCDDGNVTAGVDPLHINRRLVYRTTRPKMFVNYMTSQPMDMADLSPRDGERVRKEPQSIHARIVNVQDIVPETASVFVDKLGGHPTPLKVDPKTGEWTLPLPKPIKHGYFFVSLTARDRRVPTLWREASWLFIITKNASK
jgi:peptidoglycan/xylan/chitin deacetylase (PgdA/CDA1 family)